MEIFVFYFLLNWCLSRVENLGNDQLFKFMFIPQVFMEPLPSMCQARCQAWGDGAENRRERLDIGKVRPCSSTQHGQFCVSFSLPGPGCPCSFSGRSWCGRSSPRAFRMQNTWQQGDEIVAIWKGLGESRECDLRLMFISTVTFRKLDTPFQ